MHILKPRHYEFICANLVPGRYPLVIKGPYDTKGGTEYPTWKLTLTTVPGAYGKGDLEIPFVLKDEAPEIVLYAAENYNGDGRPNGNRLIAKVQRGMSYVRWTEFCRIIVASGINIKVEGDCQPIDPKIGIKSLWLDCMSKESFGDYPAKNYALDWAVSPEVFEAKRKARESTISAGVAEAASGASGNGKTGLSLDGAEDDIGGVSKRRIVNLEDEPDKTDQNVVTDEKVDKDKSATKAKNAKAK